MRSFIHGLLTAAILAGSFPAQAGLIGTNDLLAGEIRSAQITSFNAFLARQDVRQQLAALGVAPEQAAQRATALTDEELRQLSVNLADQPAGGGALDIVGIVFIVLIILELVGVIDVFKAF